MRLSIVTAHGICTTEERLVDAGSHGLFESSTDCCENVMINSYDAAQFLREKGLVEDVKAARCIGNALPLFAPANLDQVSLSSNLTNQRWIHWIAEAIKRLNVYSSFRRWAPPKENIRARQVDSSAGRRSLRRDR